MDKVITPGVVATEAVMTLAGFDGAVVLVEGPTDLAMMESIIGASDVRLLHSVNKDIALEALSIIDAFQGISEAKRQRVIALADADFDHVLGISRTEQCFLTDHHDVELTLLSSPCFERWLREYADQRKLALFGGVAAVRQVILEFGSFLGALRLLALRRSLAIDFKEITYDSYIDKRTLAVSRQALCQSLFNKNRRLCAEAGLTIGSLQMAAEAELEGFTGDLRDLVQGHDALAILGLLMRYQLASMDASLTKEEVIASSLRLAFRPEEWRMTLQGSRAHEYLRRTLGSACRDAEG